MALFKGKHLRKTLNGEKTQTRRRHRRTWKIGHKYGIRDRWFNGHKGHIIITRKFKQRLGDISRKDLRKEGFESLDEFKADWIKNYGHWDPDEVVTAYEYRLADQNK